jgi:hypothetical protein
MKKNMTAFVMVEPFNFEGRMQVARHSHSPQPTAHSSHVRLRRGS